MSQLLLALRKRVVIVFSLSLAVFLGVMPAFSASAVGTLDQQYSGSGPYWSGLDSTHSLGQLFTASASGLLDRITLDLKKDGTPGVVNGDLFLASNGLPTGNSLASSSINESAVSSSSVTTVSFDFLSPAAISAGNSYVFVVSAPNAVSVFSGMMMQINDYRVSQGATGAQPSGLVSMTYSSSSWVTQNSSFFFATYVTPVVVPSSSSSSSSSPSSSSSISSSSHSAASSGLEEAQLANTGAQDASVIGIIVLCGLGLVLSGVVINTVRARARQK